MTIGTTGRRETRRTATRARLLEAALQLIGEGGFDTATIAEITQRADVGFGTFYGYFESKEAVLRAVVLEAMQQLAEANDAITAELDDPAEVVARAIRHTLATVDRDPVFAGFMVRVGLSGDEELWSSLRQRMERDIRRGLRSGRFTTTRTATVGHVIGAAVLGVLRAKLAGALRSSADAEVAASALVLLGVPDAEATEIATRRLS